MLIGRVKKFISEVIVELKKVSWSTKQELMEATWLVLISTIMLGTYIGTVYFVLSKFLGLLIQ